MRFQVRFEDRGLQRFLVSIPREIPKGIARGLNRAGTPTSNKFLRDAKRVLGIGRGRGMRSWKDPAKTNTTRSRASAGRLRFLLVGFGKQLPLKYFKASETRAGVSATPMNQRRIFPGTFMKGGRFPNRKDLNRGDTVFKRAGRARKPIVKQFGPAFPEAFAQPSPAGIWEKEGGERSMRAIVKELQAIMNGHAK